MTAGTTLLNHLLTTLATRNISSGACTPMELKTLDNMVYGGYCKRHDMTHADGSECYAAWVITPMGRSYVRHTLKVDCPA